MRINKLTDAQCKGFKPTGKGYKKSDGFGMYLFVSPAGAKVWRMNYRDTFGKEQTHVIGPYPLLSLSDARAKRDEFKRLLLDGVDVKAKPKKSITFGAAFKEFWGGRKDISEDYRDNAISGLTMHLEPDIGAVPMAMVTKAMVLAPLMRLDAAEKFVYARRIRMWAGQVFEWAIEQGHCTENPAAQIRPEKAFGSKPVEHFAALELSEVPEFFDRLALETKLQSVLALHMLALTWVRTGELRKMRWEEIVDGMWRVPGWRMKMRRVHLVPLSKQAMALLDQLRLRSRGGPYVFPSSRRIDRPMSENSILYLIHRIGYKGRMTGHGFRGVASTWANENQYNSDHIEMQLSHDSDDEVRGAYNHAKYLPQRIQMMQDWADWLSRQTNASSPQG